MKRRPALAIAYDKLGCDAGWDALPAAADECGRMEAALYAIAVANEPNPAKIIGAVSMNFQYLASVCLFALFVIIVLIRAAMLRKRGIRVLVFGQTDKSDFILVPLVLAIAYTALAKAFGLPIWGVLIHSFWNGELTGWIGLALCAVAITGFALTLVSFGNSFRVGIDVNRPDKLVTDGMFSISRNPIYVCFLLFFIGLFLIHRNIVIAVAVVLFALAIHRQILREERFLSEHYGEEYEAYRKKVRRYL